MMSGKIITGSEVSVHFVTSKERRREEETKPTVFTRKKMISDQEKHLSRESIGRLVCHEEACKMP